MTALIGHTGLARLDAALAWIEAHPEQHNQANWISDTGCGTAYCLAGAIVHLAGAEPIYSDLVDVLPRVTGTVRTAAGERAKVSRYALELLGVDPEDDYIADELFDGNATLDDLRAVRDSLAASLDGGS